MFDLARNLEVWLADASRSGSISPQNLNELESHLRDAIEDLTAKGLSDQEAFLVATYRLGTPETLNAEFRKVNGSDVWRDRILWIITGYIGGTALTALFQGLSALSGATVASFGMGVGLTSFVAIAAVLICWSLLLLLIWKTAHRDHEFNRTYTVSLRWLPWLLATGLIGVGMKTVGSVVHSRFASAGDYGEFVTWVAMGNLGIYVFVLMALVTIFMTCRPSQVQCLD
ncbi:MAG: hypothetical protein JNL67_18780 [Planctomycetaceae bacterium]|nr:hypothetical protein [Planctomycetaceae bacterium]